MPEVDEERVEELARVLYAQECAEWGYVGTEGAKSNLKKLAHGCWEAARAFYEMRDVKERYANTGTKPKKAEA